MKTPKELNQKFQMAFILKMPKKPEETSREIDFNITLLQEMLQKGLIDGYTVLRRDRARAELAISGAAEAFSRDGYEPTQMGDSNNYFLKTLRLTRQRGRK